MCDSRRIEQLEAELRYWKQKANDLEDSFELQLIRRTGGSLLAPASRSFDQAVRALDASDVRVRRAR